MNIHKTLLLSALFCISTAALANNSGTMRIMYKGEEIVMPVEFSEYLQVFEVESGRYRVEFEKSGDNYEIRIYEKNENGEWKLVSNPTVTVPARITFGNSNDPHELSIEVSDAN